MSKIILMNFEKSVTSENEKNKQKSK